MQNARRVARELALKVLFQVDVGKQPVGEVLESASDQLRTTLDSAVNQLALDLQAVMRKTVALKLAKLGNTISTQSARNIKSTATSMVTELRGLSKRSMELGRELSEKPDEGSAARASVKFADAAEAARANIARL